MHVIALLISGSQVRALLGSPQFKNDYGRLPMYLGPAVFPFEKYDVFSVDTLQDEDDCFLMARMRFMP